MQPTLFDPPRTDHRMTSEDRTRMASLKQRLFALMHLEPRWWTLRELEERTGGLQTSISMRLRELKKERWGGYTVAKEERERGRWVYRLVK